MFPAKIFPAEIFPQFVQTQHSRTLPTDQKSKSPGRPGGRCYSNCSAASCRRDGLLLGTIESCDAPSARNEQRPSSIIEWGNRKQPHRSIVFGPPHVF